MMNGGQYTFDNYGFTRMTIHPSTSSAWHSHIKATPEDSRTKALNTKITVELNIKDCVGKYLYIENHRCKTNIYNVWFGN